MCAGCDAYDEVFAILDGRALNQDEVINFLASLILSFGNDNPARTILLTGLITGRVLEVIAETETETKH